MDTVSVSWDVLAGIIGKPVSELQSALMIDGNDGKKVSIDQSNIDKFVAENLRTRLADQKKLGEKEFSSFGKRTAFEEVETFLIEHHGIKKGTDWKAGISEALTEAKTKAATSDEVVKTSDAYKALVAKVGETEAQLQSTKKDFREYKVNEGFQRELDSVLSDETLALALPDDKVIRTNQINSFKRHLQSIAKLEPNEKNEIYPADDKGKPLEDPNFLPLSLKSFIASNAKTFWPAKNGEPGRQPPPAGQPAGQPGGEPGAGGNKFPAWKDSQEFSDFTDKAILEGKDLTYLKEATVAFESQPK